MGKIPKEDKGADANQNGAANTNETALGNETPTTPTLKGDANEALQTAFDILKKQHEELQAAHDELLQEKVDQNNVISELKNKVKNVELAAKVGKPVFEAANGKKYVLRTKNSFILRGTDGKPRKVTAIEALADVEIQNQLIERKSGLIREFVAE